MDRKQLQARLTEHQQGDLETSPDLQGSSPAAFALPSFFSFAVRREAEGLSPGLPGGK